MPLHAKHAIYITILPPVFKVDMPDNIWIATVYYIATVQCKILKGQIAKDLLNFCVFNKCDQICENRSSTHIQFVKFDGMYVFYCMNNQLT